MHRLPLILEVKGNSLDDGPGIRTVVFFKGCPLACVWCHNPESRRTGPEISFDPKACVGCGTCLEACPEGALDRSSHSFVDRGRCTLCFDCVRECPSGALERVGREMSVSEAVAVAEKDIPFFLTSGGGVTLSGGEPTMFMEYCSELLVRLKGLGVHTIIETCGFFDLAAFDGLVYPHVDAIYYDLKIADEAAHRKYCGAANGEILENFRALNERSLEGGVELLPRIPLIPEITATVENLSLLAAFLRECGAEKVALLEYNPLWLEKSAKVGHDNPIEGRQGFGTWMRAEEVRRARDVFDGFEVV